MNLKHWVPITSAITLDGASVRASFVHPGAGGTHFVSSAFYDLFKFAFHVSIVDYLQVKVKYNGTTQSSVFSRGCKSCI